MRLTVELVPATCWYSNVRSNVFPTTWDRLQAEIFKASGHRCGICSGRGNNHPVELHEIWQYDDHRLVQKLTGLEALCPKCHQVKHLGLAIQEGQSEQVLTWLMHVNKLTAQQALAYIQNTTKIHQIRSQFDWKLDLQALTAKFGIKLDKYGYEQGLNVRLDRHI